MTKDQLKKFIVELEKENKSLNFNLEIVRRHRDGLEEENKNLKSDLAFERTMLDNVRAEYKSSQEVIKKLKEKIERWEKCFKKGGFNPQDVECLMEEDTLQELRDLGKI